jgi:3-isopropylmalate/(R)-2-methylmalate dehydratase large subunit
MSGAAGAGSALTMVEKIWERQSIQRGPDEPDLLYIDMHFVHEVSSPQAFDGLRANGRTLRRPDLTIATEDHNVPTDTLEIRDPVSRLQIETLQRNCAEFGIRLLSMGDAGQGIVHVIGPETGLTQPGMVIVCGDSHTSTHGALGALAFGIGTSEVEHVLATQTLPQARPQTMAVTITGRLLPGVTAKDLALALIATVGIGAGQGYVTEYRGPAVEALTIEERMTLCNMSIEWGARAGLVAPDDATIAYLRGRPYAPVGEAWDEAVEYWRSLRTDDGAAFDK